MRSKLLISAYVLATSGHIIWVLLHEPFSFDAWNVAVDTNAQPYSFGNFLSYWWGQYTHSNPRLGQPLTYLGYKLHWFGEITLALSFVAVSLGATVLALGRWPWRRAHDLTLWAIALGACWFALPEIGRNLFCRAYGLNYVFGAAVQLWFLVPLRLAPTTRVSAGRGLAYAALGLVAGMCNEHTGPMIALLLAGHAWWLHRSGQSSRLANSGLAGFLLGFLAIFFAPGQGERYDGLAQRASLVGRLIDRGVGGNFDIVRDYMGFAGPLITLILIVFVVAHLRGVVNEQARARALRLTAIALLCGLVVSGTLFASPKLGARFFFVSNGLLLAAFIATLDALVTRARFLIPFVALSLLASGYAMVRTMPLFHRVAVEGAQRLSDLARTPLGGTYTADAWPQVGESWWFIGDDFRDPKKREMVARYFGLAKVYFRAYDKTAPLGTTGIHLVPIYTLVDDPRPREDHGFDLGISRGFDIEGMHRGLPASLLLLARRLQPDQLASFELEVEFVDDRPVLPRPKLLVARWADRQLTGWAASIKRPRGGSTRVVTVPQSFPTQGLDLFIYAVGDVLKPLGAERTYTPWRKGIYWVLACDDSVCWVIAATRS